MANHTSWLLIANASKARLYTMNRLIFIKEPHPKNLKLIKSFEHAESRKKAAELVSDRNGEFGPMKMIETSSPKDREAEQFAIELIQQAEAGRNANAFKDIFVIAPPSFMGLLHKHMSKELEKMQAQTIEKDYTQASEQDLVKNLVNYL